MGQRGEGKNERFDPSWDDMKFPFFGRRIDTTVGHIDYDKTELGINFDNSSRYNEDDMIGIIAQILHNWKMGTNLRPHIHWMQNQNAVPNILLKYRLYDNGEAVGSWQLAKSSGSAFTYSSGTILQIMEFPEIDMSSISGVSSFVDVKLFRDVANASGEFAGADPYTGNALMKEFDFHYLKDRMGSDNEYTNE